MLDVKFRNREALPDLKAMFRVRRGLFRKELVEASLFGLDDYGCILKTDKIFEPGDTVALELIMQMPFEDIRASGLNGLVTERRKHCSNFFYSVDFVGSTPDARSPASEKLTRIREVLSRKQSIRSRRSASVTTNFGQTA